MKSSITKILKSSVVRTGVKNKYGSLKEFGEHLEEDPSLLTHHNKKGSTLSIKSKLIKSSSNSYHLIFYDENLISLFDEGNAIFIDSTSKVRPYIRGVSQFMTIMAKKYNTVVPIAWVLMSRRTSQAYDGVWKFFQEKFPSFFPERTHCDFEKAAIKSLRNSFPGIIVKGCWFHYVQATTRKAKSKEHRLYVKDNWNTNKPGHEIIRKIGFLALLPSGKIEEGVTIIHEIINCNFPGDKAEPTRLKWERYIKYFNDEWIKKVKPTTFSVYNMVDRTNNYLESYHSWLWTKLRTGPTVFKFLMTIIKINQRSKEKLEKAKRKMKDEVAKKAKTRLNDEVIRDYWLELYSYPPLTVKKFLKRLYEFDDQKMYTTFDRLEQRSEECDNLDRERGDDEEPDDSDIETEEDLKNVQFDVQQDQEECEDHKATDKSTDISENIVEQNTENAQTKKTSQSDDTNSEKITEFCAVDIKNSNDNGLKVPKRSKKRKIENVGKAVPPAGPI